MPARFLTTLAIAASLLVSGQVLAQHPMIPDFQRGQVLTADELNRIVGQVNRNTNASGASLGGTTHAVDCESGETITTKMAQAQPGDTIEITGTCNENVVVDRDGITLDGGGTAMIDAAGFDKSAIAVIGHQNVTIKGFTVQNGLMGIHVAQGAAVWLEAVTAQNARSKDGHVSGHGIFVADASNAILTGAIVANSNGGSGIQVWGSSKVGVAGNLFIEGSRMPPASLQANDNGSNGIEVVLGSSFFAFDPDGGTSIQLNNNSIGLGVVSGSAALIGDGAALTASGNTSLGVKVIENSTLVFNAWGANGVTGTFRNNGTGIQCGNNSSLNVWDSGISGVNIEITDSTGIGLFLHNNGTVDSWSPATSLPDTVSPSSHVFSNNGDHGIAVYTNSTLLLAMPSEIRGNSGNGINIWGSAFVTLGRNAQKITIMDNGGTGVSAGNLDALELHNVSITGNHTNLAGDGPDVAMGVGSTLHWWSDTVDVDTIHCHENALVGGNAACE